MQFDPEMMASMQKMMADNPGMMQTAMDMMKKNPGMMAQAQKQMTENPDMIRTAMNAMKSNPSMVKNATQALQQQIQVAPEPQGTVIEQVQRWKDEGNKCYKEGKYTDAVDAYRKALARLPLITRSEDTIKLQIDCHNNLATCTIKLKEYKEAVRECQKVLNLDPTNFKGLLRRGQALMGLENFERAQSSLEAALSQQPSDSLAQNELTKIQQILADNISEDKAPDVEQVAKAEAEKAEGNTSFKAKDYDRAIKKYESALDYLYPLPFETKAEWQDQALSLMDVCHLNIAACYVNTHQWRKVVYNCSQVLSRDQHKKAFFRRAQGYSPLGELYLAREDLETALSLDGEPSKEAIQAELTQVQAQIEKAKNAPAPAVNPADAMGGEIGQQIASMPEDQLKTMTDMMANMDPAQMEMMAKMNPAMKDATPEQLAAMREKMKNLTPQDVKQAAQAATSGGGGAKVTAEQLKLAQQQMENVDEAKLADIKRSFSNMTVAQLKQSGPQFQNMSDQELQLAIDQMKNATPESFREMAKKMQSMTPEQIEARFPGGVTPFVPAYSSSSSSDDMPSLVSPSSSSSSPFNPALMNPNLLRDLQAAQASGNPMAAMTPELMKMSMDMMANMTPETLQQMTEMMGSMGGTGAQSEEMKAAASMMKNMDPAQFRQMQEQMKSMKPEDLEKMMNYAQKVQKVTGPCMKVCKPVWTLVAPCVRRTIPAIQTVNRAMGGQLLGISACLVVVSIYMAFLA